MLGQTISHYKIVSQLGVGGMGVVYAAEDPRLNRQVALKFVPDDLAHEPQALERLRSEARTASSLNHPNICTIYDIGEHEGRPFIVMELLKGVTLRDRLTARRLKMYEAVDVGIQVADALFWAHSQDIIHRDIKPANLFLVEHGQVKVLDFGLAKLVAPHPANAATAAPTVNLTVAGSAVGTVLYMSPEQVSGEPLDRRTDLFSLGVVLYECVTGELPFTGKTSGVILAAILTQSPRPPVFLNPDVPPRLQDVINSCLEKDRELRCQDADSLRADLRRIKRDLESVSLKTATISTSEPDFSNASGTVKRMSGADASVEVTRAVRPQEKPAARRTRRGLMIAGAAVLAIVGLVLAVIVFGRRSAPASESASLVVGGVPQTAAGSAVAAALTRATTSMQARNYRVALAASEEVLRSAPGHAEAARIRDEARAAIARFDEAIVEVNQRLAAGDAAGASRALNTARDIDPVAPAVSELAARVVEQFNTPAAPLRTPPPGAARPQPPLPLPPGGLTGSSRGAQPGAAVSTPAPSPSPAPSPAVAQTPVESAPAAAQPLAPPLVPGEPAIAPPGNAAPAVPPRPPVPDSTTSSSQPAAARPEAPVDRRPPAPPAQPPSPEDDDAAIRRVVGIYARAIETKDLALFRSVKPNLSAAEQRRIEEGFRAVTSQRVTINVLSIDHRGQEASVRLGRHDVIQAGGRQQTADSQQTMTLIKTDAGWVISQIGG